MDESSGMSELYTHAEDHSRADVRGDLATALGGSQRTRRVALEPRHVVTNHLCDLGVLGGQLHRRVDHQASHPPLRAHQIDDQPVEVSAHLSQGRTGPLERTPAIL